MERLSDEKIKEIINLYTQGRNCSQIVSTLRIDKRKIKKILLQNGINYTEELKKNQKEKLEQIVLLYSQGVSQIELEKKLGLTRKTIREVLKNNENVEYRDKSIALRMGRGHYINDNAFDDLTNPEALYFIGLLYTDGHINQINKQNCIEIKLHEDDLELLEKFKKFLKCNYNITKTKDENSYRLKFFSKRIIEVLKDLGFTSNKTLSLIPDERLVNSRDFWRGCIDGDGCLHYNKNIKYPYWSISLVGTYETCLEFINYFKNSFIKTNKNPVKQGKVFQIHFSHKMAYEILEILYKNASVYMERKYKKYIEMKNFYNN